LSRLRPSPAAGIALLALFVSLGGTTYAVTALPTNSVGTAQLKDAAVTEDELANRSVISRKLATGAVIPRTIARASITGSRIAPNAIGGEQVDEATLGSVPSAQEAERTKLAQRALTADRVERVDRADRAGMADTATLAEQATTADHARHADVADALSQLNYNVGPVDVPEGGNVEIDVPCGPGLLPVGGGFIQRSEFSDRAFILDSAPADEIDGWHLKLGDDIFFGTAAPIEGDVYAVCIDADES
jgi:hypothetical protein